MRLLISLLLCFTIHGLWSQTEFVRVFTDQTVLHRISTNGSLIAAVGQKNEWQIAVKTLDDQGELLGESSDFLQYISSYDDVIVLNDSNVVASAHYETSHASGGSYTGSAVNMYNAAAERTAYSFLGIALESTPGTSSLTPVANDRFLYSSGGTLAYAQLNNGSLPTVIENTSFEPYPFPDYHFLENWQDSLAVLVSNELDSLFLRKFNGELVQGIPLDRDITATCLVGNTLWLTDDTYLYQYTLPALEIEQIAPLPEAPLTLGLAWIAAEGKLLSFERDHLGSSDFWLFDPIAVQWEELGQVPLPNAKLLDMIYNEGSYLFCGSYLNVFGETSSFVGKSGDPIFEFPESETDIGIEVQLELIDTSFFESFFQQVCRRTWDAEVTLTNHGIAPVEEIIWKSDEYLKGYHPVTPYYEQLQGRLEEPLLPTESITFTTQFATQTASYNLENLEVKLAAPYTICFQANAANDFGDTMRENNVACPTWEMEPEMISNPGSEFIRMYPNPATDRLYLEASASEQIKEWRIFGALGNIVDTEVLAMPAQEVSIDLPPLSSGLYWIGIYTTETEIWYSFFVN
jgi:hypothetical protein